MVAKAWDRLARQGDVREASLPELLAIALGLTGLTVLMLVASGSVGLITQSPWLDECLTLLVVNDPSFRHGLAAIHGGVENTPPAYFMAIWPIARLAGGLTAVELRIIDCGFILLACVGVYATCRLFVERERAIIGALVVAIHPAVVVQMFQVRFYGFWLVISAWLVFLSVRAAFGHERRSSLFARCALAAVMVASHWFGVIGLGLLTAGDLLTRRTSRQRIVSAIPLTAGLLTLAACLPLLRAQRTGLTVPTWLDSLTLHDAATQALTILGPAPMILIGCCIAYRIIAGRLPETDAARLAAIAPGLSLLLFPVLLAALSILLQPVLRARYMIPTVIPIGMLTAWVSLPASDRRGRLRAAISCVALVAIGGVELRQLRRVSAPGVAAIDRAVAVTDSLNSAGVGPIVFLRRFEQHPVIQRRPTLAPVTALIDFDGDGSGLPNFWLFERDMARRVNRMYPGYRLAREDTLNRLEKFFVVARSQDEFALRRLFPGRQISLYDESVFVVRR